MSGYTSTLGIRCMRHITTISSLTANAILPKQLCAIQFHLKIRGQVTYSCLYHKRCGLRTTDTSQVYQFII